MIVKEIRENRRLCSTDLSNIENYDKAIADKSITWVIHHRLETHNSDGEVRLVSISRDELKALGMYYNRPADELIFLTSTDHTKLHNKYLLFSEETRRNMSIAQKARKGKKQYMQTEEYKRKVSEAKKKAHIVTRGSTGMHWYNNGIKSVFAFECPKGFVSGRLIQNSK